MRLSTPVKRLFCKVLVWKMCLPMFNKGFLLLRSKFRLAPFPPDGKKLMSVLFRMIFSGQKSVWTWKSSLMLSTQSYPAQVLLNRTLVQALRCQEHARVQHNPILGLPQRNPTRILLLRRCRCLLRVNCSIFNTESCLPCSFHPPMPQVSSQVEPRPQHLAIFRQLPSHPAIRRDTSRCSNRCATCCRQFVKVVDAHPSSRSAM